MTLTYDMALIEKPISDGLNKFEAIELLNLLNSNEFYPIEFEADHQECSALGYITARAAEKLNYDYGGLRSYIGSILDDLEKENPEYEYEFGGLKIWMGYGGDE